MKRSKIVLLGSPISTNSVYRSACRSRHAITYMTNVAKSLKESYQYQLMSQWKEKPLEGNLNILIEIFFKTKRKSDWDNFHKLSMDAMNKRVWNDDNQIQQATVIKNYDPKNPRIEITIL